MQIHNSPGLIDLVHETFGCQSTICHHNDGASCRRAFLKDGQVVSPHQKVKWRRGESNPLPEINPRKRLQESPVCWPRRFLPLQNSLLVISIIHIIISEQSY